MPRESYWGAEDALWLIYGAGLCSWVKPLKLFTLGTSHLKMMTYVICKICLHQEFFVFFFKEVWLKEMLHFWGSVIKMDMHTLLYLKWIINKVLLYGTWNSVQCYVAAWMGGEFGREGMVKSLHCSPGRIRTLLISDCCCLVAKRCRTLSRAHGLQPTRLLCPWNSPGRNTAVGCHFLLQGIFPTQGLNPSLLRRHADSLPLNHQGSPLIEYTSKQNK